MYCLGFFYFDLQKCNVTRQRGEELYKLQLTAFTEIDEAMQGNNEH